MLYGSLNISTRASQQQMSNVISFFLFPYILFNAQDRPSVFSALSPGLETHPLFTPFTLRFVPPVNSEKWNSTACGGIIKGPYVPRDF